MYSKLGGCLGDTAKLGPIARTDLCADVKGLLDRLVTHFGLGSSKEDPWGSLLGGLGVELPSQEPVLSAWEAVLFPLEAWRTLCLDECLGFCLPDLAITWLPAWVEGRLLPAWEGLSPAGVFVVASLLAWEELLSPEWGELPELLLLSCFLPLGEGELLPACLSELLLSCFLPQREGEHLSESLGMPLNCFLPWGRWAPAWTVWEDNKLFLSSEGRWAPAWLRYCWTASFPRGKVSTCLGS